MISEVYSGGGTQHTKDWIADYRRTVFSFSDGTEPMAFDWEDSITVSKLIAAGLKTNATTWSKFPSNIKIGYGIKSIYGNAFNGCTELTGISLPNTLSSIKQQAFYGCTTLTSINVPDSVTQIGVMAFGYCYGIKEFNIPNGVSTITDGLFYECKNLERVYIPSTVDYIQGNLVFLGCDNLLSIFVSEDNTAYQSPNGLLISKDGVYLYAGGCGDVQIPNGVSAILDYAFSDRVGPTQISIPSSVERISPYAFNHMTEVSSFTATGITSFVVDENNPNFASEQNLLMSKDKKTIIFGVNGTTILPSGVTTISANAFRGFDNLGKHLAIPSTVGRIGKDAFLSTNIEGIYLSKNYSQVVAAADYPWGLNENQVFHNSTVFEYSDGTATQTYSVWSGELQSTNLTAAGIKQDVTTWKTNPTNVKFSQQLTSIGPRVFDYCSSLLSIALPNTIRELGQYSFEKCTNLKEIHFTDMLQTIGSYAFQDCTSLSVVDIPGTNLTSVGFAAFYGCSGITDVIINEGVRNLNSYAFSACRSISNVVLPESLESIDMGVFYGCHNLTSVTIPKNVLSVNNGAFADCGLRSITIEGENTELNGYVFMDSTQLTSITFKNQRYSDIVGYVSSWGLEDASIIRTGSTVARIEGEEPIVFDDWEGRISRWMFNDTVLNTSNGNWIDGNFSICIGYNIDRLDSDAFYGCNSLTSVEMTDNVKSIGANAFYGCNGIASITIPKEVELIGKNAFGNCTGLTAIVFTNKTLEEVQHMDNYPWGVEDVNKIQTRSTVFTFVDGTTRSFNWSGTITLDTLRDDGLCYGDDYLWVVQPTSLNVGYGVTAIDNEVMLDSTSLTSVVIPDTVVGLGRAVFRRCSALRSVIIPKNVASIDEYAFDSNTSLTSVVLENGDTEIGQDAFNECTINEFIVADKTFDELSSKNDYPWGMLTIDGIQTKTTTVKMQDMTVERYDFQSINQPSLEHEGLKSDITSWTKHPSNVNVGIGVDSIGDNSFNNCTTLSSITMANSIQVIGISAFCGCTALTGMTIPNNVMSVGMDAFVGCANFIDSTSIPGVELVDGWLISCSPLCKELDLRGIVGIADGAFRDCTDISSIWLDETIRHIGTDVFVECTNLHDVVFRGLFTEDVSSVVAGYPWGAEISVIDGEHTYLASQTVFSMSDGTDPIVVQGWNGTLSFEQLVEIGMVEYQEVVPNVSAYLWTEPVSSIKLGSKITEIGVSAFQNCPASVIEFPSGLSAIGDYAFRLCRNLQDVVIPNSVVEIGKSAFESSNIRSINLPSGVKELSYGLFCGAHIDSPLIIPYGISSIPFGFMTLQGCSRVVLPETITQIGNRAFCHSVLQYINLPSSLEYIDEAAFALAYTEDIQLPDTDLSIGAFAFAGNFLTGIYIPPSVQQISEGAFYKCPNIISAVVDGGQHIGKFAFQECRNISSIIVGDGISSIGSQAFAICPKLKSVVIGQNVTEIGENIFWLDDGLTDVMFMGKSKSQIEAMDNYPWDVGAAGEYLKSIIHGEYD